MTPENNSNAGQTNASVESPSSDTANSSSGQDHPPLDSSQAIDVTNPASLNAPSNEPAPASPASLPSEPVAATSSPLEESEASQQPHATPPSVQHVQLRPKRNWLKLIIFLIVGLAILAGVALYAYNQGKSHAKVITVQPTAKPINLPPQAVVTAECTPGRGKQYIIPKDIPQGPIYDVENSKVIAIEYLLSIKSLFLSSDTFSNTILRLVKNYPVDHFTIVPAQSKQGDTDQYIHLIMFIVPKAEANSITCAGTPQSSTSTQQSTNQSTSNSSSSSSPTTSTQQTTH